MALDYLHIFQQVHIQYTCVSVCLSVRRLSHKTCTRTHTHRVRSLLPLLLLLLLPLPLLCALAATDLRRLFLIRNNFPVFQPTHTHAHTQCTVHLVAFSVVLHLLLLLFLCFMFAKFNIAFKFVTHTRTWRHLHKFPLVRR